MEAEIKGGRYGGIFKASVHTHKFQTASSGGADKGYYYEGAGIIKDKKTNEKYFFAFQTDIFEYYYNKDYYNLKEAIIFFNQKRPFCPKDKRPRAIDDNAYEKIIELSLENIVSKIKKSDEELPLIEIPKFKEKDLFDKGLIFGENGEIKLRLD